MNPGATRRSAVAFAARTLYWAEVTAATRREDAATTRRPAPRTGLVLRAPRALAFIVAQGAAKADM